MNTYYHYEYSNGTQFTSFANWTILSIYLKRKGVELPKLIGRWNIKIKNK